MKHELKKFLSLTLALLLSVSLLSPAAVAAGGEGGVDTPTGVPVLNLSELSLKVGEMGTLTVEGIPEGANITWYSFTGTPVYDGSGIAAVTKDASNAKTATVTAKAVGKAIIVVSYGHLTATCKVTVTEADTPTDTPVDRVTLNTNNLDLTVGDTEELTATIEPENATNKDVTWESDDEEVATVSTDGTVSALKAGKTTITVTTEDGGKNDTCEVTVTEAVPKVPVTDFKLDKEKLSLTVGGTPAELTATITPADATDQEIKWTSSGIVNIEEVREAAQDDAPSTDPDKATVKFKVTAVKAGKATITATCDGKKAECEVTVSAAPVAVGGVTLNETALSLKVGNDGRLIATVSPEDATNQKVTWDSSDKAVATVKPGTNGKSAKVTPLKEGTTTITVTTEDGKKTASCKVTVSNVDVTGVKLTYTGKSCILEPGKEKPFTAMVLPNDATIKDVEWTVADSNIATVTKTGGVVTGKNPGTTTLTATSKDNPKQSTTLELIVSGIILKSPADSIKPNANTVLIPEKFGAAANVTSWEWRTDDKAVARVTAGGGGGVVTGIGEGTATITCSGDGYSASCKVTVSRAASTTVRATLDDGMLRFSRITGNAAFKDFAYLTSLTVPPAQGTLYYGYVSNDNPGSGVAGSERYYLDGSSPNQASRIVFVPKPDFDGQAAIKYTGYNASGAASSGEIVVPVERDESSLDYSVQPGEVLRFPTADFNDYCLTLTGKGLSYVTFSLPSSRYGKLYYNYTDADIYESTVSSDDRFYRTGSPALENVALVPGGSWSGVFELRFTGYDTSGQSFSGTARITVGDDDRPSSSGNGDINYTVAPGKRVYFDVEDFSDYCYSETDYQLNYLYFTSLPSSGKGELRYGRTSEVTTSNRFYRNRSSSSSRNLLENVNFLADEDYTGTFTIPFAGYNVDGDRFTGVVEIEVTDQDASVTGATIRYTARPGKRVYFDADDFNAACRNETGDRLSYVRFPSLPGVSRGTLRCGSSGVSASTSYYYSSGAAHALDDVSFTPASDFTGTVTIPFRGRDSDGVEFDGNVSITVSGSTSAGSPAAVSYSTGGRAVTFKRSDFADACGDALPTGPATVRLGAPSPSVGGLYLNYAAPSQYRTFTSGQSRPVTELDQLSFVPKAGFQGTVSLPFTLYDVHGSAWSGAVNITVTPPNVSTYFSDLNGTRWAVPAVDFLRRYGVVAGVSEDSYGPRQPMRRGDFVLMLNNAFSFPKTVSGGFPDVPQDAYYASAIAAARELGVIYGDEAGNFRPRETITRLDAALFLYRSLQRQGGIAPGSAGDLSRFSDADSVPDWAAEAMGALVRRGVFAGDNVGRLNPGSPLTRAEMAVILYQAVT